MAYSGNIGVATTSAVNIIDHAFRRCRLPAQSITPEMQQYAIDSLGFFLAEIANNRTPSWCIDKKILPLYENQPLVTLPVGTVDALGVNYRTLTALSGSITTAATSYQADFTTSTIVNTVGVKWSGASVSLTFQVSSNGTSWTTVGTQTTSAVSGEITWTDISGAKAYRYFKITAASTISYTSITLGNSLSELPLGRMNMDDYVTQNGKNQAGRPNSYYFQRDLSRPVIYVWPAPNSDSEVAQIVLWRHRQVMDLENLRQEVEVPARWFEALVIGLAARLALCTPSVDLNLIPVLEQKAAMSLQSAWAGDGDGAVTRILPSIGAYTR